MADKKEKMSNVSVRLPDGQYSDIKGVAAKYSVTPVQIIRWALDALVSHEKIHDELKLPLDFGRFEEELQEFYNYSNLEVGSLEEVIDYARKALDDEMERARVWEKEFGGGEGVSQDEDGKDYEFIETSRALPMVCAAAGLPINSYGHQEPIEVYQPIPEGLIGVKLCGTSMKPTMENGGISFFLLRPHLTNPHLKKGEVYLFRHGDELTVKRYNTRLATGKEITEGLSYKSLLTNEDKVKLLISDNSEYSEIVVTDEDFDMVAWWDPRLKVKLKSEEYRPS